MCVYDAHDMCVKFLRCASCLLLLAPGAPAGHTPTLTSNLTQVLERTHQLCRATTHLQCWNALKGLRLHIRSPRAGPSRSALHFLNPDLLFTSCRPTPAWGCVHSPKSAHGACVQKKVTGLHARAIACVCACLHPVTPATKPTHRSSWVWLSPRPMWHPQLLLPLRPRPLCL